ncbi:MAG: nucleotide pyrophosphohydrolase [Lachnospiraceae bacterium]|nr:nucleotide pyrophosphohydrolase [Lachnospiraceae bacterium]
MADQGEITIKEAQKAVDEWITTIGVKYFSPLTNMAILAEETGEVARAMARLYGDQKAKGTDNLNLAEELADVMWVTMAIANQTGVDLTKAFSENLRKKTERDKDRFKEND